MAAALTPPDPTTRRSVDDDLPEDITTSETLSPMLGETLTFDGTLSDFGDRDWIRIEAPAGALLGVGVDGLTFRDPALEIYDDVGDFVAYRDDQGFLNEGLNPFFSDFYAEDTVLYVAAQAFADQYIGDYTVYVSADTVPVLGAGETIEGMFADQFDRNPVLLDVVEGGIYQVTVSYDDVFNLNRLQIDNNDWAVITEVDRIFRDPAVGPDEITTVIEVTDLSGSTPLVFVSSAFEISDYSVTLNQIEVPEATLGADLLTVGDSGSLVRALAGDDTVIGGAGVDSIEAGGGDDSVSAGGGSDRVVGGLGNDRLEGEAGDDRLVGRVGMDTLEGGTGMDTLMGGPDADVVDGGEGDDRVDGGLGDDSVLGGDGADLLTGYEGRDTLEGGTGDDTLDGGVDDDLLTGGDGFDLFRFAPAGGEGDDTITDFTAGEDSLDVTALGFANDNPLALFRVSSLNADGDMVLTLGPGRTLTLEGVTDIGALSGSTFIAGTLGADMLRGGMSDEVILGLAGEDTIRGSLGFDTIAGGAGDDVIDGGLDADVLSGGLGADSILGGGGYDFIVGEQGNDTVSGGNGDDYIDGGADDDVLSGGAGFDDLIGGRGNDLLDGGDGVDYLYGDLGRDTLDGGAGDDWLSSGGGNDLLTGGLGQDLFFFRSGDDTITDFSPGEDFVDLGGLLYLADRTSQNAEGDLVLNLGPGRTLTFDGFTDLTQIEDSLFGFDFLIF